MADFLYFSTYLEYRIPIESDGTAGTPEVIKKFTNPMTAKGVGANKNLSKPKKKVVTENKGVEYL